MRIIAGSLGGQQFDSPSGNRTHPMSQKVCGALFNSLGDISGLTVLDAFTGSGALSFESISRGASQVVAIDIDKSATTTVVKSAQKLGIKAQLKVIRANAASWSANNQQTKFDIVICDPPYDDIRPDLLQKLADHSKVGGVVVLSLPPSAVIRLTAISYQLLATKTYGDAKLVFYRRIS